MGEELEETSNVSEDSEGMGWERARKVGTIGETGKGMRWRRDVGDGRE